MRAEQLRGQLPPGTSHQLSRTLYETCFNSKLSGDDFKIFRRPTNLICIFFQTSALVRFSRVLDAFCSRSEQLVYDGVELSRVLNRQVWRTPPRKTLSGCVLSALAFRNDLFRVRVVKWHGQLPPGTSYQGEKACLLIRKQDHFTPTREIRRHEKALALYHPGGRNLQRHQLSERHQIASFRFSILMSLA